MTMDITLGGFFFQSSSMLLQYLQYLDSKEKKKQGSKSCIVYTNFLSYLGRLGKVRVSLPIAAYNTKVFETKQIDE